MKRTIITIVILIVAVIGSALILKNNKENMLEVTRLAKKVNSTVPVQVAEATSAQLAGSFTATGNFSPAKQLLVVSEASGKITSLTVDEGQYVKKGQLLARVDHATLEAELRAAEANLKKLRTDRTRYENLITTGGVTQAQLEEINLNYVNAETRFVTAKKKLSDTYITAPFSGYVNKRFVELGSWINTGKEVFEIVDLSTLKMVVNVTESQVLAVDEAKDIKVYADVYPGVQYKASVNFIGAKADGNLNFPVELKITNIANKPLRAGMFGRATFELPNKKPVLVIPRVALVGSVNDAEVFTVVNDQVKLKKIVVGRQFADKVEVIRGIEEGARVVTSGQINLYEGVNVTVLKQ